MVMEQEVAVHPNDLPFVHIQLPVQRWFVLDRYVDARVQPVSPDALVIDGGAATDIPHADAEFSQIQLRGFLAHEGNFTDRRRSGDRP